MIYLHLTIDDLNEDVHNWVTPTQCSLSLLWFCTMMISGGYVIFFSHMIWVIFQLPNDAARLARQEIILLSITRNKKKDK